MKLCLINHGFRYELEKLVRIFFPFEKIEISTSADSEDNYALTELSETESGCFALARLKILGKSLEKSLAVDLCATDYDKECELKLAIALYECFVEATGYTPGWGILTGVRPAKLFSRFSHEIGNEAAEQYFKNIFRVSDKKVSLCRATFAGEDKIISLSDKNSFSLYISIPFCPTRCSYCSFVSHSVEQAKKLIPAYVDLLCKELEETAKIARAFSLKLETVYIGGGTPTAVSAEQLNKIMSAVATYFDLSGVREYTVEAGRPDTVTEEKLKVIKQNGATRISINPQTMNDGVLQAIGRKHTAAQTTEAFNLARSLSFDNINMDLIAGLPTDTLESFSHTVGDVLALNPESVTVHALSMKRSSTLNLKGDIPEAEIGEIAAQMVDFARDKLSEAGIVPYYMYRQSKTVGNLENVGYSKAGYECLYNVYIMDETHTILACGASAVTKLREPDGDYIERIFNFKYPYEYINQFDEILSRKSGVREFYSKYGKT
ncbi:MAG: coproporphyrinogen dehydrogenase HemZ [Clostridia bacterium]|nr:coproporphyrinogen dehydrogenase HemZ [Clostridia bacterium]